jgi:hypothetical protein
VFRQVSIKEHASGIWRKNAKSNPSSELVTRSATEEGNVGTLQTNYDVNSTCPTED